MQLIDLYRRESSAKSLNDDVLELPISMHHYGIKGNTQMGLWVADSKTSKSLCRWGREH
jgi:hypothetical protein